MELLIRDSQPDEWAAIGRLTLAAYRGTGEVVDGYADELLDVATRARQVPVLAAIDRTSGAILGTATYVPGPGPYHEGEFGDVASMRMLAVAPDAQGHGIGRALAQACIDRARAEGRSAIALYTRPVMTVAQRMYESLGFRRVPELDWEFEPGEWLWTYRLEL